MKILVKDLIKKDTQTLLKERAIYEKKFKQNCKKYCELDKECRKSILHNDLTNANKCLKETEKILHLDAEIRDIIDKYNRALKRKGYKEPKIF